MAANGNITSELSRADFGEDFIFGSASSAYQVNISLLNSGDDLKSCIG